MKLRLLPFFLFFLLFNYTNAQEIFEVKRLKYSNITEETNQIKNDQISQAINSSSPSGNEISETEGNLSVSLTGGANYQVPIKVPAGIDGVEPDIALTYNSQGGNGLAGYGWNISGISVISRIPSTEYHDGTTEPVDFSDTDRFSFDGQRLLLKSGTHGQPNAVYQTEKYSNIKIETKQYLSDIFFQVSYPDGSRAMYGSTPDSRNNMDYAIAYWVNPQGVKIAYQYSKLFNSLSIKKIKYGHKGSSAAPNEIDFIYKNRKRPEQSYAGGTSFIRKTILDEINVTSGGNGYRNYYLSHNYNSLGYERLIQIQEKSGDNSSSYSPINFTYNTTSNTITPKGATSQITLGNVEQRNAIATSLDVDGNGKMDFTIHSKTSTHDDKFWLFKNVQDLNSSSINFHYEITVGRFEEIFPVNWLTYSNKKLSGQGMLVIQNSGSLASPQVSFRVLGQSSYNGLAQQYSKNWNAPTYTNDFSCDPNNSTSSRIPQNYLSGDFNGDGLSDVIAINKPYSERNCYPVLTSPGEPCGFDPYLTQTQDSIPIIEKKTDTLVGPQQESSALAIEPIDGCCRCETRTNSISQANFIDLKRNITSGFANNAGTLYPKVKSSDKLITADVNGDGKTNIIHITSGQLMVYGLNQNNQLTKLFTKSDSDISTTHPLLLGDYNGDGKTDILIPRGDDTTSFRLLLSTGENFVASTSTYPFRYRQTNFSSSGTLSGYNLVPTDINGDGRTDIIDYKTTTYNNSSNGTQTVTVYKNTFSSDYYGRPKFSYSNSRSQTGDLKHFPIPIFLSSKEGNNNLDFAAISDNRITSFSFSKDNREDMLLRSVSNNGVNQSINYNDLGIVSSGSYSSNYQSSLSETYPYINIEQARGFKVVEEIEQSGTGLITKKKSFSYYDAINHLQGLGFSGFKGVSSTNWYTNISDRIYNVSKFDPQQRGALTTDYSTDSYVNFTSSPSDYITKTEHQYDFNIDTDKVITANKASVSTINELEGTVITENYYYDQYNNQEEVVTHYPGNTEKRIQVEYNNNPSGPAYFIGLPKKRTTISTIAGNSYTSEEEYTYNGLLVSQKKTKGNGTGYIVEDYTYDTYGNIISKTTTPPGESSKQASFEYDSSGRFLLKEIDSEGLETEYEYYSTSGMVRTTTDPFGFETGFEYDSWFRPLKITDHLGNEVNYTYNKVNNRYTVTTYSDDGTGTIAVYDKLYRVVQEKEKNLLGSWVTVDYEYDHLNRIKRQSEPHIGGSASQWNTTDYDKYGRTEQKTFYTGKTVNFTYNGLETTIDDGTKQEVITKDALGNIVEKTDPGGTIQYIYFGNGNLKQANYGSNSLTIEQDGWGRKTKLTDPSAGIYTYEYNGFGEIVRETNPKGETNFEYDSGGRVLTKQISGENTDMEINYTYNPSTKLLSNILMTNGSGNISDYSYTYDTNHRLLVEKETTDFAEFETTYTYNTLGQVLTEEYSAQDYLSSKTSTKKIKNTYQNGGIIKITDNTSNSVIWELEELNARGQTLQTSVGNGIIKTSTYDNLGFVENIESIKEESSGNNISLMHLEFDFNSQRGLLDSRQSSLFNWNETFTYDNLDRLTGFDDNTGNGSQSYDQKGRISLNSKLGNYGYTGSSYQQTSLSFNNQGQSHFQNFSTQSISYNVFKQPVEIHEHGKDKASFNYNAFEERSDMFYGGTQNDPGQRRYRKHYSSNGRMEIKFDSDNNETTFVSYIGGDAYSAPIIWHSKQGSSTNNYFYYLHRDYLGSILGITDADGNFKEKRHFDAWGDIVKLEDGNGNAIGSFDILDRGYTGHEHLLGVGIVHMNGRLYDPVLHRFLSPDNYVQDPFNSQNFNRYGYVLNNPLKFIDSSGESFKSWWNKNWKQVVTVAAAVVVGVAVTVLTAGTATPFLVGVYAGAAGGFTGGALGTALNGGNFGEIMGNGLIGAGTGALFGGVGAYAASFAPAGIINGGLYGGVTNAGLGGLGDILMGGDGLKGAAFGGVFGLIGGSYGGYAKAKAFGSNIWTGKSSNAFMVTPDGVILPKNAYIPKEYIDNPYGRSGSYGKMVNGKFVEMLRIDPGTAPGYKGPSKSHFHLNGGSKHIFDISKWPWWKK